MATKKKSSGSKGKKIQKPSKPAPKGSNNTAIIGIAIVAVIIIGAVYFLNNGRSGAPDGGDGGDGAVAGKVPNQYLDAPGDPTLGSPDALVVLHEFADFQCPACGNLDPILEEVYNTNAGKIALVYDNFPLVQNHKNAYRTALAGECAEDQGKFWELKKLLYQNQANWSESDKIDDFILAYADEVKIDSKELKACMETEDTKRKVNEDMDQGRALNISSTPSVFLNNRLIFINGREDLIAQVQQEIAKLSQ